MKESYRFPSDGARLPEALFGFLGTCLQRTLKKFFQNQYKNTGGFIKILSLNGDQFSMRGHVQGIVAPAVEIMKIP